MDKQAGGINKEKVELFSESQSRFKDKLAYQYDLEKKKLGAGLIGKILGTKENAPYNIAGIVLLLSIVLAMFVFMFLDDTKPAIDFFLPIVTLALGYIFGQKK
jgi:hypothetical protein